MIDTERKEDLFLDTKLIKSENRLDKLRIIDELHPVLGGQPTHEADQPNDNNPFLDLACTMQFTIDKVNEVDKKADTKLAKAQNLKDVANVSIARDNLGLGTSATMNATSTLSDRTDQVATIKVVNDVNRAASTAQKTANTANDKANAAQNRADSAYSLAGKKWDIVNVTGYAPQKNADNYQAGEGGYVHTDRVDNVPKTGLDLITKSQYGSNDLLQIAFPQRSVLEFHMRTKSADGWSRWFEFYHTANTTIDKSGFLRASGSANALVESDVTNSLGNSKTLVASQALVNSLAQKIDDVPVDKIFAFESTTPPKGYIARNGQAIDKATMPKLYARYGAKMPDDRDRVLRMAGSLAGSAGSTQEDAMQKIIGNINGVAHGRNWGGTSGVFSDENFGSGNAIDGGVTHTITYDNSRVARTSTETRVKSRIVILCNKIQ